MAELTAHLHVLETELVGIVEEMEAINARTAAAAHYCSLRTCRRFLTTPAAVQGPSRPGREV